MVPFTNFTKGEVSPELYSRMDTSQYQASAKKVRNFIIQRYGGLSFRPGFRLVAEVDAGSLDHDFKYIPFQFNIEQSYIMALGNQGMRLLAAGGVVLEEDLQITAITKAANAQVTAAFHAYVVGDRVYFSGVTGMTELNGLYGYVVSVIDAGNFTVGIDTRTFGTFASTAGAVRAAAPPPPLPPPTPPPVPPEPTPEPPTTYSGGSGAGAGRLTAPTLREY